MSRRERHKLKKAAHILVPSAEKNQSSSHKKIIDVKDKWVKDGVTIELWSCRIYTLEAMFSRVQLERKTAPKKFVAANGQRIRDLGEMTIRPKTNDGTQRRITSNSASMVKPFISIQELFRAGNIVVLDEKNPHIRKTRD